MDDNRGRMLMGQRMGLTTMGMDLELQGNPIPLVMSKLREKTGPKVMHL